MTKLAARDEVAKEMTWDLTLLYPSLEAWEQDFLEIDERIAELETFNGQLGESAAKVAAAFEVQDRLGRLISKVYTYAHLESDQDTAVSETRSRLDRISGKYAEVMGKTAWFEPELLALDDAAFNELLNAPELAFYRRSLEEILRNRPHALSAAEERVLGLSSEVLDASSSTFSVLNNADLTFPKIDDGSGNQVELTHGNYVKFLEHPDRAIRKGAFDAMYTTFGSFRNTFASTLSSTIKKDVLSAKLRKHDSALDASLHPDNVPAEVYNNLIGTVHKHLPAVHKYYDLRRRFLKLDTLEMCDVYTPLVADYKLDVSWTEACEWVQEACKPLGEDYCTKLKRAFGERWIDVYENRGKRSGAYSSGCYDSVPYVLMNYNGTLNHVFTLAHELGHSMHSFYSREAQEYHYASYKIFVAEVASTTNELLLHHYLYNKTTDKNFKLYLLNHLLDGFKGTVFRQTMFAEFEKEIHDRVERGEPLTADSLTEYYYDLNKRYHGDAVKPDEKIGLEWARIPHFYYNFYVYKYATGFSAAVALSKNILSGDPKKIENYLNFLKAGSSKDVLDILADAGVDLRTPAPIDAALNEFSETLKLMETELFG